MEKKLLCLLLLITSGLVRAQLIVTNTQTPAQLVQNVLVDPSVVPTNIMFNGAAGTANVVRVQAARFSTNFNATNLGLSQGLLLTTGDSQYALGPNTHHNDLASGQMPTIQASATDPDLATLSGNTIGSCAVLEFDFVATGLELNFDFVFASEEYAGYVNSINDAFGFFLRGPGITGPYTGNAKNIALIPATNNPITINSVNNGPNNNGTCTNCAYYFNNSPTGVNPNTSTTPTVEYDGFTTVLTAKANLQCGQTYHIKLAVGNISDDLLDSAVFLKGFRIKPMELYVSGGFYGNTITLCNGQASTIISGITPSANIFKWYKDGVLIPSETTPDLPVSQSGVYTLEEYTPSGCLLGTDDITIVILPAIPATQPLDLNVCGAPPGPYQFNINQTSLITSTLTNLPDYEIAYYDTNAGGEAFYGLPTGLIPDADLATYSISSTTATIYVRVHEISSDCVIVKSFNLNVIPAPSGSISYSASPYCDNVVAPQPITNTGLTMGGTYSATPAGLIIDPATGAITGFGSTAGTYTVKYDLAALSGCSSYSTSTTVVIDHCTCTVTASSSLETVCLGTAIPSITYTSSTVATSGSVPAADLPPGVTASFSGSTFTISGTPTVAGTYPFTVTLLSGATDSCSATTTIEVKALPTATISGTTTICSGDTATITFSGTPGATVTYTKDGGTTTQTVTLDAAGNASITTLALTSPVTYDLVSIDSNGTPNCSQTLSGSAVISIKSLPTASISGTATICSGDTATITFTGTAGATVTYTDDAGTTTRTIALDGTGTGTLTTLPLTSNTTFDLISVETGGTPNCSQVVTGSVTITIKALPTATISGTTTVCSGSSATITFTGTANATVTYTDDGGVTTKTINLDALGTGFITPLNFTVDTTYTLVSIASNGTPNCSQNLTGSAIVTVKAIPTATISGTATICSGTSTTITFTGTPDAEVTFTDDAGATTQTVTLDASGNGSVTTPNLTTGRTYDLVSITTVNGLPNCGQTLSGSAVISIVTLPTASISGATTICSGATTPITFTGTANAEVTFTDDGGVTTQTITLDGTGIATLNTPALTSNRTYDLVSVAITGTSNCSQNITGSVTITVNALPTATISGTTTICSGTSTTITFTGTPGATVTYTDDAGATNKTVTLDALGTATVSTLNLTSDATYDLVRINSNGVPNCTQTLTGSVTVTIIPLPIASISGSTTICSGTTAPITFTGTPNAIVTYTDDGGLNTQTITLDNTGSAILTTLPLTTNTTFDLVSVATTGTPSCSQSQTGSVTITIKALPTASISGTTTICSGASATITFTGTPGATVTYKVNNGADQTIPLDALGNASITTLALTNNTTYDLVSVETGGTPNCSQTQTGSAIITVNSLPTASISGDTICSGTSGTVNFTGTPGATVTFNIGAGANQSITLDATGNAALPTLVLTNDATYNLVSVSVIGATNCSQTLSGSALVRVLALPTATISGTTQLCLNSPRPLITFTGANGQSPYTFTYSINSSFPQTISTAPGSDSVTLPVATTAAGTFIYDLISVSSDTTPSCSQPQLGSAVVTILALPTASISGTTQVCINDTMPQITFTGNGGQPPYTFNYTINNGPVQSTTSAIGSSSTTVSVLTTSPGTFVYNLVGVSSSTTPSCSQPQTGTATVLVRPASLLTTTSLTLQSVCVNTPIAPIVLNLGGSATGVTVTGLPNGVTGSLSAAGTVYTISGSANTVGVFNYSVTTTGGCTPAAVISGSITVNPNVTIALTTANNQQTLCINTNISQIQYTIGNGAVSASVPSGSLPTGITAIFSAGVLTISGTALQAGTFPFTVTTLGGCSSASLSGTLVVKPEVELVLTSAPVTTLQNACIGASITPIRYNVNNGATGATVTGLPTGITWVYSGGVLTISGSSSQVGTHPYVVTTVGGCGTDSANGSITINPNVTIALTSVLATTTQELCINKPIDVITYKVDNGATGASLIAGTVPDGIQGTYNPLTGIFTISGIAIEAGNFTYTISTSGGCGVATLTGTIIVDPLPVINLPQNGFICVDVAGVPTTQYMLTTNLHTALYTFEWSDANGVIAGETGNSYTASSPGLYTVKVTNRFTGCFDMQSATILPSLPPSQVTASVTGYFEQNQMVTLDVSPPGNYLYQLDTGLFQEDAFFTNLFSGYHTVTVKDKFGCGTAQVSFRIVNFPRFFTPNDDGYNDTWNIFELANDQPDAYIYIFDRYGKLLKEISVQGEGWDGKINGFTLPSSDYWFKVFYREHGESKEFRSHFSLKR